VDGASFFLFHLNRTMSWTHGLMAKRDHDLISLIRGTRNKRFHCEYARLADFKLTSCLKRILLYCWFLYDCRLLIKSPEMGSTTFHMPSRWNLPLIIDREMEALCASETSINFQLLTSLHIPVTLNNFLKIILK
jgi:hypothetical protein